MSPEDVEGVEETEETDEETEDGDCYSCGGSGGGERPMICRTCEGTGRADCGRPQRSEPEDVDADERASRCGDWSAWRAREW